MKRNVPQSEMRSILKGTKPEKYAFEEKKVDFAFCMSIKVLNRFVETIKNMRLFCSRERDRKKKYKYSFGAAKEQIKLTFSVQVLT
jgi:hypothetical protein